VCLATAREYREESSPSTSTADSEPEQATALAWEEKDWPKSVWKEVKKDNDEEKKDSPPTPPAEKIWTSPMVLDPRISMRMRRFDLTAEDEARARAIVVPEEEIEGWIKGSVRSLWRWAFTKEPSRFPVQVE
jgi:import inner membrane translocase subunit TIM54